MDATSLIIFGVFCGILGWFILKRFWDIFQGMIWPISVSVGMQRGNTIVWDDKERGRLLKAKDGYQAVRLKKRKHNIKPPQYKYLGITDRGKPRLQLLNVTAGQYYPLESILPEFKNKKLTKEDMNDPIIIKKVFDALKGKIIPIEMTTLPETKIVEDASAKNWGIGEIVRINSVYKPKENWWNRYGTFIMSAILAATIIFTVMFFSMKMETISGNFAGASKSFENTAYIMKGMTPPGQTPQNNTQPQGDSGINILGMTIP